MGQERAKDIQQEEYSALLEEISGFPSLGGPEIEAWLNEGNEQTRWMKRQILQEAEDQILDRIDEFALSLKRTYAPDIVPDLSQDEIDQGR